MLLLLFVNNVSVLLLVIIIVLGEFVSYCLICTEKGLSEKSTLSADEQLLFCSLSITNSLVDLLNDDALCRK